MFQLIRTCRDCYRNLIMFELCFYSFGSSSQSDLSLAVSIQIFFHLCLVVSNLSNTVTDLYSKIFDPSPPFSPLFFIFMQFSGKFGQTTGGHPLLWSWRPLSEILDAPL